MSTESPASVVALSSAETGPSTMIVTVPVSTAAAASWISGMSGSDAPPGRSRTTGPATKMTGPSSTSR
jgi:hypothetical protein